MQERKDKNSAYFKKGVFFPPSGEVDFLIFCKNGVIKLNRRYGKQGGSFLDS